jgi:hypothetical protein
MTTLLIAGVTSGQIVLGVLLYWVRVSVASGPATWDAVTFGVPLVAAAGVHFVIMKSTRSAVRGFPLGVALSALALATVGQAIAMTIAFNVFGT